MSARNRDGNVSVADLLQAGLASLDSDGRLTASGSLAFAATLPISLGWDSTHYPFGVTSIADILGTARAVATLSVTPESLFDATSTARNAPGITYYVDVAGGSDSNNGLTVGAPFQSMWKAVVAGNAAAVSTKVVVKAGTYPRANNPWYNGGTGVIPTVDIAWIADGGRVVTGTFDSYAAPTRDATQTNCYSFSLANAQRVMDLLNTDRFGNYVQFTQVSTAALCNTQPWTWALVAGTIYINRGDQVAVTRSNTRVYRTGTNTLRMTSPVNCYLGGTVAGDGFDFESSQGGGALDWNTATPGATRKVLIARDCSFKYGGGYTDTGARGVSVESINGLAAFFNCRADGNVTDGFNFHNTNAAAGMNVMTVNCTGFNNGFSQPGSNQGWTSHDDVKGIDICGYYDGNHGATCRSINTSKSWFLRTTVKDDLGDIMFGGAVYPTAFRVDNTAVYYCERTRVLMPAGTYGYVAGAAGSTIHKLNVDPCGIPDYAVGTIDALWP